MKVSEIFKSIQGEVDVGMPSVFIRLSGCNLNCKFCDSKYAKKGKGLGVEYITKKIDSLNCNNVVFTGGEPLLQKNELSQIMFILQKNNPLYNFYLETNGTINDEILNYFKGVSCSPKKQAQDYNYTPITQLKNVRFKFVYENKNDKWWEGFINKYQIPKEKVWIMPEGKSKKHQLVRMKEVANYCIDMGYNFTPRVHVLIWGRRRGV